MAKKENMIRNSWVRMVNEKEEYEVKVYMKELSPYTEANIQIPVQEMREKGVIVKGPGMLKVERWLNQNKEYVVKRILLQYPTYFE